MENTISGRAIHHNWEYGHIEYCHPLSKNEQIN